jgi:type VI secretion system secreted protein Hcp
MRRSSLILAAAVAAILASFAPTAAAALFIKFDGIQGETSHAGQAGWIEATSIQWVSGAPNLDALRPGATATGGPGVLRFDQRPGASSRLLRRAFESKQRFGRVQLEVPKAGQETVHYTIVLTDVVISSFIGGGTGRPTENLSLNFTRMEYKAPATPLEVSPVKVR